MGIEPTRPAWKAGILPLNYTRKILTLDDEIYSITTNIICQEFFQKKIKKFFRAHDKMKSDTKNRKRS